MKTNETRSVLRSLSVVILIIGAIGSLGFMFHTGRNNPSVVLMALFTVWVLSPYVVLLVLDGISTRWTDAARRILYGLMLFLTLFSLLGYSGVLIPSAAKPAFVFLVVPLISLGLIVLIIPIVVSNSRKRTKKD